MIIGVGAGLERGHGVHRVQQDLAEFSSPLDEDVELALLGVLLVLLLGDDLNPHRELMDHEVHVGAEQLLVVVVLPATVLSDGVHEAHQ